METGRISTEIRSRVAWSSALVLEHIANRVQAYRQDPARAPLSPYGCASDRDFRRVYSAAKRLRPGAGPDWWCQWLARGGLTPLEAQNAGRRYKRHDPSKAGVLQELRIKYQEAAAAGIWPRRHPDLDGALSLRAQKAYGSLDMARQEALRALGLRRPPKRQSKRSSRSTRDIASATRRHLNPDEQVSIQSLGHVLASLLPLASPPKGCPKMCMTAIAKELGLSKWKRVGKVSSLVRLLRQAYWAPTGTFQRLICYVVKRAIRSRLLKGISPRHVTFGIKEPIWREQNSEINRVLAAMKMTIPELTSPGFVRSVPSRRMRFGMSGWIPDPCVPAAVLDQRL